MHNADLQLVKKLIGGYEQFKKLPLKSLMGFHFTVLKPAFTNLKFT